jgi:DNA-binding transcriptional LysR family regulator
LLDRTTRRVEVTDAGRALLTGLGEISAIWQSTTDRMAVISAAGGRPAAGRPGESEPLR